MSSFVITQVINMLELSVTKITFKGLFSSVNPHIIWVIWVICILSPTLKLKCLSQILHLNGFSPVWIRRCSNKWLLNQKVLSQILHLNGFSSECNRLCVCKTPLKLKVFNTHYIGMAFLQYEPFCVVSAWFSHRISSCKHCSYVVSHQYDVAYVLVNSICISFCSICRIFLLSYLFLIWLFEN